MSIRIPKIVLAVGIVGGGLTVAAMLRQSPEEAPATAENLPLRQESVADGTFDAPLGGLESAADLGASGSLALSNSGFGAPEASGEAEDREAPAASGAASVPPPWARESRVPPFAATAAPPVSADAPPPLSKEFVAEPPSGFVAGPSTARTAAVEAPAEEAATAPRTHRIQDGDTLAKLAAKYLGSADREREIYLMNRDVLETPDLLPIGREILIPSRTAVVAPLGLGEPLAPVIPRK